MSDATAANPDFEIVAPTGPPRHRYRWTVPTNVEAYRTRAARRVQITSLGGFFPILARLRDGRIGAIVREGDGHVGQRGWLGFLSSQDGETWSEPRRVADGDADPCHTAFGVTPSGALLCSYVYPHAYKNGVWDRSVMPLSPVYLTRSDNDGRTWSDAAKVDTSSIPAESCHPYGRIIALPDGTLLMNVYVAWARDGGRLAFDRPHERSFATYVLRSRDDGRTWGDASLIARDEHGETALAYLPSGTLLAATRRANPDADHDVWLCESADLGRTWSTPRRITDHGQAPADLLPLADGRLLLVFGHRSVPFGARGLVSHDGGRTWKTDQWLIVSSEGISRDCGYPSAVQLDSGRIVVAYYQARSPGPFVPAPEIAGPYAAALLFEPADLP